MTRSLTRQALFFPYAFFFLFSGAFAAISSASAISFSIFLMNVSFFNCYFYFFPFLFLMFFLLAIFLAIIEKTAPKGGTKIPCIPTHARYCWDVVLTTHNMYGVRTAVQYMKDIIASFINCFTNSNLVIFFSQPFVISL